MEFIKRRLIACIVLLAVTITSLPVFAEDVYDDQINDRPGALAMFSDLVLARPLLLVGTAVATTAYVITLPVWLLGGNVKEAGNTMVVGIAKATFTRCLGCTEKQNDWKNQQHATNEATAAANNMGSTNR